MKATREKPTKRGYYWAKPYMSEDWYIVEVNGTLKRCFAHGDEYTHDVDSFEWWQGPLEPPSL